MDKNFFGYIIEMLQKTSYRNKSEEIQMALGKYYLPSDFKGMVKKIKRVWQR